MKIKIRYKNWYWGKFIFLNDFLDSTRITRADLESGDFELYDETKHGLQNEEN